MREITKTMLLRADSVLIDTATAHVNLDLFLSKEGMSLEKIEAELGLKPLLRSLKIDWLSEQPDVVGICVVKYSLELTERGLLYTEMVSFREIPAYTLSIVFVLVTKEGRSVVIPEIIRTMVS